MCGVCRATEYSILWVKGCPNHQSTVHLSVPLLPSSLVLESRVKKKELRMSTVSLLSAGSLSQRYLNHGCGGGVGGVGGVPT